MRKSTGYGQFQSAGPRHQYYFRPRQWGGSECGAESLEAEDDGQDGQDGGGGKAEASLHETIWSWGGEGYWMW